MSLNLISKSSFSLAPLNESAYELNIHFSNEKGDLVSDKKFTFLQQQSLEEGEILDVYSQNGTTAPAILKHLFEKRDEQEVKKAAAVLKPIVPSGPIMVVLDLQDPHTHYSACSECVDETIAKCEGVVCDFFQKKTLESSLSAHAKKIHKLFQESCPLNFVLCEGSLKMDLLKYGGFTDAEIDYFQNSSVGPKNFCQCAEFFMNGFKLGQTVRGAGGYLLPEKFIQPVSSKFTAFKPYQKSTVFYPASYKELYSLEGEFAKVLSSIFCLKGGFNAASKITTISVEKKS